nr:ATP-binding cassette domain-containing protein [Bacillus sp. ISL-57]
MVCIISFIFFRSSCIITHSYSPPSATYFESGSGKSTLAKLIVKLYQCGDNQIFINNLDICSINTDSLRKKVLYLSQNTFFLKGTIKENLCLGKEFSAEDIDEACRLACMDNTIKNLPYQYNYTLSEDASNLSIGQKQRLSIARALLHKPDVIIFDEITSNIDKGNTDKIMENLKSYNGIKLFITHKIEDLDYFDKVYTIKQKTIHLQERRAMMS